MSSEPNAGGRGRILALAVGGGLLAFLLGAGIAGRSGREAATAPTTTVSSSTTTTVRPTTSVPPTTEADQVLDHPVTLVLATETQLFAVDLKRQEAVALLEIETGLGIPGEEFNRLELGADDFVYFDRIRAELRGATFRLPVDGTGGAPQRLTEGVSPAVQHDVEAGSTRLVTLGRRDSAEMFITNIGPTGAITDERTISAEANTVPKLRHPSWAPASVGPAQVVVEWIEVGKASQLIVVEVDSATSLDGDDHAASISLPKDSDWTLPVWPSENIHVISRLFDSRTQLTATNPVNGFVEALADGGDVIHHGHDALGNRTIIVDGDGTVSYLRESTWEDLDFDNVVIETPNGLASLTTELDSKILAADW